LKLIDRRVTAHAPPGLIFGVNPDYRVEVRLDVLEEIDGPMLELGLQGFHGSSLWVPPRESLKPDRHFLEERYALFRHA